MTIRIEFFRKALALPLSALLIALSVAVPLMERADFSHATAVESHHDPARCGTGHDHTICTQTGANLAAVSRTPTPFRPTTLSVGVTRSLRVDGRSTIQLGPPSRAPPLV